MIKVIIVILLLLLPGTAEAMGRDMQLDAEGRIEYNSHVSNSNAKAGLDVRGDGQLTLDSSGAYTADQLDQSYGLQITAKHDTLLPIRAITAAMVNGQTYALMVAPGKGETGALEVNYEVGIGDMYQSQFTAEAVVDQGEFRSYVNITANEVTLEEELRVRGSAWFIDMITVSLNEGGEE